MKYYDVVIVGAGPSGQNCALNLKDSGLDVLIIDKSDNPGLKVCAGGIRLSDIEKMNILENMIAFKNKFLGTVDRNDLFQFLIQKFETTNCI